jgi:hypothetical protein
VLSRRLQPSEHRALLAAGDALASVAAVVMALWLWSIPAGWQFSAGLVAGHAWWFAAAGLWLIVAAFPAGPSSIALSLRRTVIALVRGAALLLVAYGAWYFYAPKGILPRLVVLYFLWDALLLTLAWRLIFVAIFSQPRFLRRAIVVGSGRPAALALATVRQNRGHPVSLVGIVLDRDGAVAPNLPVVAEEDLLETAAAAGVSELILALSDPPSAGLLKTLLTCQEAGAQVVRVQTLVEQSQQKIPVDYLEPDWLMTELADAVRLGEASWIAKRLVDVAGALGGTLVFVLLTPLLALLIRLDSRGPVFYRQQRAGRGGTPFRVLKFRTMQPDAERPGEARWADRDDPRTTRIGRLLRKTRLCHGAIAGARRAALRAARRSDLDELDVGERLQPPARVRDHVARHVAADPLAAERCEHLPDASGAAPDLEEGVARVDANRARQDVARLGGGAGEVFLTLGPDVPQPVTLRSETTNFPTASCASILSGSRRASSDSQSAMPRGGSPLVAVITGMILRAFIVPSGVLTLSTAATCICTL